MLKKTSILIALILCSFHTFRASGSVFQVRYSSVTGSALKKEVKVSTKGVVSDFVKPVKVIKLSAGHYVIDFGKAAFGTLSLVAKSSQRDSIAIHLGEKLSAYNTVDRKPGGFIQYQKVVLQALSKNKKYLLKLTANKRNTNPPAIALPDSMGVVMPFRYCEIENLKIPIGDLIIRQKVYHDQFNDSASDFTSSDTVLNQVWAMCKQTIKATSFCGLYIDGDRERTPYEADAYINQLSHYAVDNEYTLARNTNEYFIDHPTWPTEWILHTVLLFYNDYLYTGNKGPLVKYYDALKSKTLVQLEREDGLISTKTAQQTDQFLNSIGFKNNNVKIRDIVDWPAAERDGYEMVNVNTVVNAFHFINLKLMADIAGALGKKGDAAFFSGKATLVKNTINQKLFDKNKGVYVDGEGVNHASLHANMFPLAFGLVPDEHVKTVTAFIKSRGIACSVYGAQYLLEALYKQGEAEAGFKLMTATSDRSWWNMIKAGSTMALEAWDIKYKPNLDWNHAWGTAPANIITRYAWGITPAKAGFALVEVKPQLEPLTFSKIKVPTIRGSITAWYKAIDQHHKRYIIQLPKGMKGYFSLSKTSNLRLILNNRTFKSRNGSVPLKAGINTIEINY
jgi:alpha-L-rhamnosidase